MSFLYENWKWFFHLLKLCTIFAMQSYKKEIVCRANMDKSKKINYFSMDTIDLNEAFSLQNHFFNNDYLGMVMHGIPKKAPFLREGEIYHIVEPRLLIILNGEAEVSLNLESYHLEKGIVILTTSEVIMESSRQKLL